MNKQLKEVLYIVLFKNSDIGNKQLFFNEKVRVISLEKYSI